MLAQLERWLVQKEPGCIMITGEPGSGKSHLLKSASSRGAELGWAVRQVTCHRGAHLPWMVDQELREALEGQPEQPVLVAVDDVHWADKAALADLWASRVHGRVSLLLTWADGMEAQSPALGELRHRLIGQGVHLRLPRLSEEQAERMYFAAGGQRLTPEVYQRSAGNPRALTELARSGRVSLDSAAPLLQGLSPDVLTLLRLLAVFGAEAPDPWIEQLLDLPGERVLTALEVAVQQGLVVESGAGFTLTFPWLAEALYSSVITPRRRLWHERIGQLAADGGQRAYHLGAAQVMGAGEWVVGAAREAMRTGRWAQTEEHVERGLALPDLPDSHRAELLLLGGVAAAEYDESLSEERFRSVLPLAQDDAVLRGLAQVHLALLASRRGEHQALRLMDDAHQRLHTAWNTERFEQVFEAIHGGRPVSPGALTGLAQVYLDSGRPDAAAATVKAAIADSGRPPEPEEAALLAEVALLDADVDSAISYWIAAATEAERRGQDHRALRWLARALDELIVWRGTDGVAIEALAERVRTVNARARVKARLGVSMAGPLQGYWHWSDNRESAERDLTGVGPSNHWQERWRRWQARWDLAAGRVESALEHLRKLGLPETGVDRPLQGMYGDALTDLLLAAAASRRPELLARALQWSEGERPSRYHQLVGRLALAEHHAQAGRGAEAREICASLLAEGARLQATTGLLLPAHLLLWRLGGPDGQEHAAKAQALVKGLGHGMLVRTVYEALRPAKGAASGLGPLSERELEIARLVAAGHTDREIGAHLVISPRTVDAHLRSIFRKVAVKSRAGLTAWVFTNDESGRHTGG